MALNFGFFTKLLATSRTLRASLAVEHFVLAGAWVALGGLALGSAPPEAGHATARDGEPTEAASGQSANTKKRKPAFHPSQTALAVPRAVWALLSTPVAPYRAVRRHRLAKEYESLAASSGLPAGGVGGASQEASPRENLTSEESVLRSVLGPRSVWNRVLEVPTADGKSEKTPISSLDPAHFLAFENLPEHFRHVRPRTLGYCWGFASLHRKFKYLASFEPGARRPEAREVRRAIRRIAQGKLAHFPGYGSLEQLSSDPEHHDFLKRTVARLWNQLAVQWSSLSLFKNAFGRDSVQSPAKVLAFREELQRRVNQGTSPLVVFTHRESARETHVVPVYEIRKDIEDPALNQRYWKICFIDSYDGAEAHEDCGKNFRIYDDGGLYYDEWDDGYPNNEFYNLKRVAFTPEDKADAVLFARQLGGPHPTARNQGENQGENQDPTPGRN